MLHKISKCEWDEKTLLVTLPNLQSEISAVIEFNNQDWVKNLAQADPRNFSSTQMGHSPFKMTSPLGGSTGPT
jgi:hypothetical protein